MNREALKEAFSRSVPVLCSYAFVSMAYSLMMQNAGFPWYLAPLISLTVYTGAYQFVLISFLAADAPLGTMILTALMMNSRQVFYALTFMEDFSRMGRRKPYMICTMTDETYAINCSLAPDHPRRHDVMFYTAVLSKSYWVVGTALGSLLSRLIPWNLEGIDFCMTALFVVILIDRLEKAENRLPALIGGAIAVACLLAFGESVFMLPALLFTSGALLLMNQKGGEAQ